MCGHHDGSRVQGCAVYAQVLNAVEGHQVHAEGLNARAYLTRDLRVIAGLRDTITRSPQLTLLTEFWPKGIRDAGDDPGEFLKTLRELGLTLHELKADGELAELKDDADLIARHQGRRYTNIVGRKLN